MHKVLVDGGKNNSITFFTPKEQQLQRPGMAYDFSNITQQTLTRELMGYLPEF